MSVGNDSLRRSARGPLDQFPRPREEQAMQDWNWAVDAKDINWMRLLTTVNRPTLRREFCRLFAQRFPNDHDNGCPADQPSPALIGPWPTGKDER